MVVWGLVSASMAFVQGETSFYVIRFLLGVAGAGFSPGIILYLTYWYTSAERARMTGLVIWAVPVAVIVGSPLSSDILMTSGGAAGFKSWQWLFIAEAMPAIVLGIIVYFYLTGLPQEAQWLTAGEREAVCKHVSEENANREAIRKDLLKEALTHPRV